MIKIAVDNISPGLSTGPQTIGGMRMYLKHFIEGLVLWERCEVGLFSPSWTTLPFERSLPRLTDIRLPRVPRKRPLRVAYEQTSYAGRVLRWRPDVFIGLNTAAPLNLRIPSAVFIKALQCFFTPQAFSWPRRLYLQKLLLALRRTPHLLLAPTQAAAQDLCEATHVPEGRVRVVPEALYGNRGEVHADSRAAVLGLTGGAPFVLHIGATYGYKNLQRLVRSFAIARRKLRVTHKLLLVGAEQKIPFGEIRAWAREAGVGGEVVCAGRLPDSLVLAAYDAADAMVMPSLYETFGHPVLEAMVHGCPVVTSDRGALAEVAGDGAELVDVRNVEAIASGLVRVLDDSARRSELIGAGRRRAGLFTWQRTIDAVRGVIEELA